MTHRHSIRYLVGLAGLGLAILFAPQSAVESREAITQVEDYRLGSHPQSTRIIIQLSQDTPYRVLTNYADQKVVMWIRNATLNPKVQTITFRDKYLSQIQVQEIKKNVKFTLQLKSKNTRLVHFVKHQPEQIVIDLKSNVAVTKQVARKKKQQTAKSSSSASRLAQNKTRGLLQTDSEQRLKSGRKEYTKALKLFQSKSYMDALKAFQRFQKKYRESPLLANAAYMIAEAQYNLAKRNPYPNYEEALAAYQYAMRTYPDSQFYDHALFKTASIY
ncbi:MAG: tetratricopeptide repeat protein, partial [Nitrospinaceae bacterium]